MYIPAHFREEDLPTLHRVMHENSFALLVTQEGGVPYATHLPFLIDPAQGAYGTLRAHMARANPQWRQFELGQEALVVFQGPHAYISPDWYESHPTVPTWDYVAIHAYGVPRILSDTELHSTLHALVANYEAPRSQPWIIDEATDAHVLKILPGIVGFEIEITRLEGKVKMNQNSREADRRGAIEGLRREGGPAGEEVANWIAR
jgi:transcriptional regulator